MKVLFLGDRFITPEILKEAFEAKFGPRAKEYEYAEYQLQWPVVPMSSNDEVREFSGTDDEIIPLGIAYWVRLVECALGRRAGGSASTSA